MSLYGRHFINLFLIKLDYNYVSVQFSALDNATLFPEVNRRQFQMVSIENK